MLSTRLIASILAAPVAAAVLPAQTARTVALEASAPNRILADSAGNAVTRFASYTGGTDSEAYILAYRRVARVACRMGMAEALDRTRDETRALLTELSSDDRRLVTLAVDSTHTSLSREGGCSMLSLPTRLIVVDAFLGHTWNSPIAAVGKASKGTYTEDGFLLLKRGTKVQRLKAEATYTFTAVRGNEQLISGLFRVPVKLGNCAERWRRLESDIVSRYPTLRAARVRGLGIVTTESAPSDSTCHEIVNGASQWRTIFRNPDTNVLEASMSVAPNAAGTLAIVVEFPGLPGYAYR